jgi:phosphonate transport system permease protein
MEDTVGAAPLNLNKIRKESSPFQPVNIIVSLIFLTIFVMSWRNTEMSVQELVHGGEYMRSYMMGNPDIAGSSFFPPSFVKYDLLKYCTAMLETIEMAVVAFILSVLLAFPLSIFASRNILEILIPGRSPLFIFLRKAIYVISMLIANLFRSINEIVWALLFVSAVGLGPMAGILALAIHTSGVLAKLLAEGNEAIDPGPVSALVATGASFPKIVLYAVLPQTMPHFISMSLYRFESDVRSASILGFVGAGGVGFYLFDKIRAFENGDVTTIILIIVATVWVIDKFSAAIRKRFI